MNELIVVFHEADALSRSRQAVVTATRHWSVLPDETDNATSIAIA
jgi:hypothetical protein